MWSKDAQNSAVEQPGAYNPQYESYLVQLSRQRSQRSQASRAGDSTGRKSLGAGNASALVSGRSKASPLRSSASQVLQSSSFDRNVSQFFGVTPLQAPTSDPTASSGPAGKRIVKDPAWNLASGYQEDVPPSQPRLLPNEPAGRKAPKDEGWSLSMGYSSQTDRDKVPEAPQRIDITSVVKSIEVGIPAGKLVPKDIAWSPNLGYKDTVHKGNSPVKALITAGYKINKEDPWRLSEGYEGVSQGNHEKSEVFMDEPAGKKIPKDQTWRLGMGNGLEVYRKSSEFVPFSPELKQKKANSPYEYTAGRKILRDEPFSLSHDTPIPTVSDKPSIPRSRYRSLTPQPS